MIDNLPGYQVAHELGYTLFSYSSDGTMARYNSDGIVLKVWLNGTNTLAELISTYGLITLKTEPFTFPNKNFTVFEQQLEYILHHLPAEV